MPSVAPLKPKLESLQSNFPLTAPVPTPLTHPDLVSTKDLTREEDLLRNPQSFRHWWSAIQTVKDEVNVKQKVEDLTKVDPKTLALLGPLATPVARRSLQRLTYISERALSHFPGSFKLWKSYLHMRMSYVLGKFIQKKRAGGRKKFPEIKEALEDEHEDMEKWEGGLNGIVGWEEWKSLVATFERALMWIPNVRVQPFECANALLNLLLAPSAMASVSLNIHASIMSTHSFSLSCTQNLRQSSQDAASLPSLTHMG